MNFGTGVGDLISAASSAMSGFGGAVLAILGIAIGAFALEHLEELLTVRRVSNKYSDLFKADQVGSFRDVLMGNYREARKRGWSSSRWEKSTDRYWSKKRDRLQPFYGPGGDPKRTKYNYGDWSERWFGTSKRKRYYSRSL